MKPTQVNAVFRALADPTRRKVLDLLRDHQRSVTALQTEFRLSQPALSRHLKVLKDARLVRVTRSGRSNIYRLNAEPMEGVMDWMLHYQDFWFDRFRNLGKLLDEDAGEDGGA